MENVIRTAASPVIPTLYKAAAVSVIALSIAGIGAMTGYLPTKKADAPQNVAVAAPVVAPTVAAVPTAVPVAAPVAAPVVAAAPAPERVVKPRPIKTAVKHVDEPVTRTSGIATHPVAVSASNNDVQPHTLPAVSQSNNAYGSYPASTQQPYPQVAQAPVRNICSSCGTIESIRTIEKPGEASGVGIAGGALGGGVLGRQFGNGRGKDVLTVLGAIGGGIAGNQIEKSVRTVKSYEITVRMEDGSYRTVPSATQPNWRTGERVRLDGSNISVDYS